MWILVVMLMVATPEGKVDRSEPVLMRAPTRETCGQLAAQLEKSFAKEAPGQTPLLQCVYLAKPVKS